MSKFDTLLEWSLMLILIGTIAIGLNILYQLSTINFSAIISI